MGITIRLSDITKMETDAVVNAANQELKAGGGVCGAIAGPNPAGELFDYRSEDFRIFEQFSKKWALLTAGTMDHYNACTVSWGGMGTLWTRPGKNGDEITVYLHPARYTQAFFREHDTFTVSFYPESSRKALMYMGSHSGRDGDKAAQAGLTPVPMGDSVTFREAEMSFLCRKVYAYPFAKEGIADDVQAYYRDNPGAYPVDENGDWQPHWIFIGEVLEARRKESAD